MSTTLLGVAHAIMWNYNDCVGCVPLANQAMPLTFAQNVRFVLSLRQDWDRIATHGWGGCMSVYAWLCLFMPVYVFLFMHSCLPLFYMLYFVGCILVYTFLFMHSCLCIPVYAFLFMHSCLPLLYMYILLGAFLFMHSCLCIPVYAFLFAIVVHVIFF